jgi:hypothetical protein
MSSAENWRLSTEVDTIRGIAAPPARRLFWIRRVELACALEGYSHCTVSAGIPGCLGSNTLKGTNEFDPTGA